MKRQILAASAATALAAAALIGTGLAGATHATAPLVAQPTRPPIPTSAIPPAFTTPPTVWHR